MNKEAKDRYFNELMKNAYDKVYIFVGRGCRDRGFVEDVVQETFYEAYRKIDELIDHPNKMGWLYCTAKNKRMKLGIKKGDFLLLNEEYDLDTLKVSGDNYGEIELTETIRASVSEEEYEMLRDYYLNGYSSVEVADKYGVDKGGIRMRMMRLRNKLKENITAGWLILIVCIWRFL